MVSENGVFIDSLLQEYGFYLLAAAPTNAAKGFPTKKGTIAQTPN
jgi:hypothetical protein